MLRYWLTLSAHAREGYSTLNLSVCLSVSQSFNSALQPLKAEVLDYLSPFNVLLFKVLRLFSRKSS